MPADVLAGVEPVPGVPKPDPILIADGITRRCGGLTAVDVDHVEIQRGLITALIGPNVAGKTTFFNLLTGFDQPDSGRWTFDGNDMSDLAAYKVARLGMVRTFQLTKALSKMSVIENMKLGANGQVGERFFSALLPMRWRRQENEIEERGDGRLGTCQMTQRRDRVDGTTFSGNAKAR